jgi:DNA repair protein RecN (Recombination protein N)
MLLELLVENYAVVEQARIRFGEGLNVLTGETGSGKSIVVDSFGLLLGARASADAIRSGETRARICGIFSPEVGAKLAAVLREAGIEHDPNEELIVEREIASNGKSRAFVANRPATTALLRQLSPALGDIHGQNEQQQLFSSAAQRELLDEFARAAGLRRQVAGVFGQWQAMREKLAELNQDEQEKLRLLDLWTFQRKEIESVAPRVGEDAALEAERKVLQNVTRLLENAAAAFDVLYESPTSASGQLRQALKRVEELARIDAALGETASQLKQAVVLADEAGYTLRDYLGKLEADPNRLEDVEGRLEALDKLKRKYGRTMEEILAFHQDAARRADEVEHANERKAAIEKQIAELAARYERLAGDLSAVRAAAAERLGGLVAAELKSLAMGGTELRIAVRPGSWTAAGADEVAFLVSPNRGEELKPLERIASGGELSRMALALKTVTGAGSDAGPRTLVFDEVDAGVGGAAAAAVGKRLKALSRTTQVICVTHLAQIAGFADRHYAVSKKEAKGRVTTLIEELSHERRAREIGRMLSGEEITPEALRQAEQLMQAGGV